MKKKFVYPKYSIKSGRIDVIQEPPYLNYVEQIFMCHIF